MTKNFAQGTQIPCQIASAIGAIPHMIRVGFFLNSPYPRNVAVDRDCTKKTVLLNKIAHVTHNIIRQSH